MATANTITIAGNLTRDPELRFTPNGRATASFGVAVNNDWTDPSSGERRESTDFFDVVVWGKPAENAAQSLSKGQEVVVSGRLQQRSWETNEGERRTRIEVIATVVGAGLSFGTTVFTKDLSLRRDSRLTRRHSRPVSPPASPGSRTGTLLSISIQHTRPRKDTHCQTTTTPSPRPRTPALCASRRSAGIRRS